MVGNGSPQAQAGSGGCVARWSLSNQPRGSEIPYCRSRARRADLARGSPARQSLVRWRTAAERSSRIQAAARAAADRPLRPRQRIGRLRAHRRRPCAGGRCRCAGSYRPQWRAARACKPGAVSRQRPMLGRSIAIGTPALYRRPHVPPARPMRGPRSDLRPTSSSWNRAVALGAGARHRQCDCDRVGRVRAPENAAAVPSRYGAAAAHPSRSAPLPGRRARGRFRPSRPGSAHPAGSTRRRLPDAASVHGEVGSACRTSSPQRPLRLPGSGLSAARSRAYPKSYGSSVLRQSYRTTCG